MMKMDSTREKEIKEILQTSCRDGTCNANHFNELQNFGIELRKSQKFAHLLEFLSGLGNKDRLMIVKTLKDRGAQCVCELEAILDKSQPSISHHLRTLERIGLIRGWKKGKFTYYELMRKEFNKYLEIFNENFNLE